MIDLVASKIKIIRVGEGEEALSNCLIHQLVTFSNKHYEIAEANDFIQRILQPNRNGEVVLFYRNEACLAGFTRIYTHTIEIEKTSFSIYYSLSFHDPVFNINVASTRTCLTQALKDKLRHPERKLFFFFGATSPEQYTFLTGLNASTFPRPDVDIPAAVFQILEKLKKTHHLLTIPSQPFLINDLPKRKIKAEVASLSYQSLHTFYHSLNPECDKGDALLVYIPMDLSGLSQGIRKLVAQKVVHQCEVSVDHS